MFNFLQKYMRKNLNFYSTTQPALNLKAFYTGSLEAHGVARSIFGRMERRFVAQVRGRQEGTHLILNEDFTYDDGRVFCREWTMVQQNPEGTKYGGTGADIFGEICGETSGASGLLMYTLKIPSKSAKRGFKTMDVVHWQYLIDSTHTLHFLTLKRFGIPVLKSTVMFHRLDP